MIPFTEVKLAKIDLGMSEVDTNSVLMHMLGPTGEALFTPVHCKDFYNEVFFTAYTGQPVEVYGFRSEWSLGKVDPAAEWYYFALSDKQRKPGRYTAGFQHFYKQWCEAVNFPVGDVKGIEDVLVIEVHNKWTLLPIRLSLVTLLMRLGVRYPGGDIFEFFESMGPDDFMGKLDYNHLAATQDKLRYIFQHGLEGITQPHYSAYTNDIYKLHNHTGIVAWALPTGSPSPGNKGAK